MFRKAILVLLSCPLFAFADFKTGGFVDGTTRVTVDLPASLQIKNTGGSDGSGLCVYSTVNDIALWQNVPELMGFQKWAQSRPGGSYPEKLASDIATYTGGKFTAWIQHTGGDEGFLEAVLATGRAVGITYDGRDQHYRGRIAHMLTLVYLDKDKAAIMDNNFTGVITWESRAELMDRWKANGGGWAVALLAPPPTPYTVLPLKEFSANLEDQDDPNISAAEWKDKPGAWAIYDHGVYAGTFYVDSQKWEGRLPRPRLPLRLIRPLVSANYGLDVGKFPTGQTYSHGGKLCSREEAIAALFPDDSGKPYLTVVGDDTLFQKVMTDAGTFGVLDKTHIQRFDKGGWQAVQFNIPEGVSLRKAAGSIRVSTEVGSIPGDSYSPNNLRSVLATLFPSLTPTPAPTPVNPLPIKPVTPSSDLLTLLLLALGGYLVFRKPKS